MKTIYPVLMQQDKTRDDVARVPDLRGCHTYARSIPVLMKRVREAIELCLAVEGRDAQPLRFVGIQQVSVPA